MKEYYKTRYLINLMVSTEAHSADDAKAKHVSQVQED